MFFQKKNTSTLFPSTFPSTFPCSRHPPPASYQSRHLHPLRPARLRPEPECQARRSTLDGERADLRTDKVFQKARSSCAAPPDSALAATSDLPDGATPETVTDSFPSASPPSCDYCGLTIPGRRGRRGMQTGSRQRQAGTGQQEARGQRTEDRWREAWGNRRRGHAGIGNWTTPTKSTGTAVVGSGE